MKSFSYKHKLHFQLFCVPLVLFNIFHFNSKCLLLSFSCQTCFVNSVLFRYLILLKSLIWFPYLSLNVVSDSPIYLFIFPSDFTVAWYTILGVRHFPLSGQLFLFRQLQRRLSSFVDFNTELLCPDIIEFKFFIQLELIFIVFLLNILCSLLDFGKCLSNSLKNTFPIFVCTFLEYGGLNQIIFLFRFLCSFFFWQSSCGVYSKLVKYPLSCNAFS